MRLANKSDFKIKGVTMGLFFEIIGIISDVLGLIFG